MTKRRPRKGAPRDSIDRRPESAEPARPPRGNLLRWGWLLAGAIGLVLYAPSIAYDFTLDDVPIVRDNFRIRDLGNPQAYLWTSYWSSPGQNKEYRPITMLSYALTYGVAELNPAAHHGVNVVLHALVCMALWWLIALLFGRPGLATLTASLFALHPIHVEAVAGVVGRAELLCTLGFVGALISAVGAVRAGSSARGWGWALLAGACTALAVGSKENGAMVFAVVALLPVFDSRWKSARRADGRRFAEAVRDIAAPLSMSLLALGLYLLCRRSVLGGFVSRPGEIAISSFDNPLIALDGFARFFSALKLLGRDAALLVWPYNPSPDYSWGVIRLVARQFDAALIGIVLLFAFGLWVLWRLRRRPACMFGVAFGVITFSITSNVVFPIGAMIAERLLYLPSLGFCLLVSDLSLLVAVKLAKGDAGAMAETSVAGSLSPPKVLLQWGAAGLASLWMISLPIQLLRYQPAWTDNVELYEYTLERAPGSARAHQLYGLELFYRDRAAEAVQHLETSNRIYPDLAETMSYLAAAYLHVGRVDEAQRLLEGALARNPDLAFALMYLARIYLGQGDRERAEKLYPMALRAKPYDAQLRRDYGRLLESSGKALQAIEHLEQVAPSSKLGQDEEVALALVRAYTKLGRDQEALEILRKTEAAHPRSALTLMHRFTVVLRQEKYEEARSVLKKILELEPTNESALRGLETLDRALEVPAR